MPKRSNPFQQLIAQIERDIAAQGVRVTESVELTEYDDSDREIDVLIEGEINGFPVKIAIECRDHGRKQDTTWMDSLIGKYKHLGIDKIVAVSSSGFSTTAIKKAKQNGIITKTLEEATETNWPKELQRYIVEFLMEKQELKEWSLNYELKDRELTQQELLKSKLVRLSLGTSIDPQEFIQRLFESQAKPAVSKEIRKRIVEFWADNSKKSVTVKLHVTFNDLYIELVGGDQWKVDSIDLSINTVISFSKAEHKYYTYDSKAQVVAASLEDDLGTVEFLAYKILGTEKSKPQVVSASRIPKKQPKGTSLQ